MFGKNADWVAIGFSDDKLMVWTEMKKALWIF
jgi:hypothetical protein